MRHLRVIVCVALVAITLGSTTSASAKDPAPDGRIAFELEREIYVMDSDGGNLVNLSRYAGHDGHPVWSPDGARLAFTSTRDRVSGAAGVDIYVVELRSGRIDRVTWDSSGGPPSSWSPDGTSIVYVSGLDGEIYSVAVATGAKARLTTKGDDPLPPYPAVSFDSPSFSPDGSHIAYTERSKNFVSTGGWPPKAVPVYSGAIFVMGADGSSPTRLTNAPTASGSLVKWTDNDQFPAWSPDGSHLVFSSDRHGVDNHDLDLYVVNADGSGRYRLTTEEGFVGDPVWSPDGTQIAYSGNEYSFVIDVDGRNRINLGELVASRPSWSADGTRIAVGSILGIALVDRDGSDDVVVVPQGIEGEQVLAFPLWQPVHRPVGLVDPATGIWHFRGWDGNIEAFYYGNPGDYPFVGDWDCDGFDTPGLFRQSDAFAYLRNSTSEGVADIRFFFGNPSDVPLVGDFNGDGCDTLSVYRPSEQRFYIVNELGENEGGLGAADFSFLFGNAGDKPVVGDWDGDGVDEVGLHRESTGSFYWRDTLTSGPADGEILFGNPGDRFVPGDWGVFDGVDSPAVFRPSRSTFFFRHDLSRGVADAEVTWPAAGNEWLPVAGNVVLD